jgi:hypothetical protein
VARTRDIRTNQADIACDVCGRTLLRGERPESFLAGGQRRQVCELCTDRAQHEGWIRESGADDLSAVPRQERRGRGVLERLRERRERAREAAMDPLADEAVAAQNVGPLSRVRRLRPTPPEDTEAEGEGGPAAEAPAPPPRREPVRASREPRQVRAVPTNAELKNERALELFNASPYVRTVGGVARSLGPPAVCVRPLPQRPSVVTITVMWELSWYRFEVDLSDEAGGVRRDAQGAELSELDPQEMAVNAAADERGALHLATPAAG